MSVAAAVLAALTLVGHWTGHTRGLDVHRDGTGVERVDDGCCTRVFELRFRVIRVAGPPGALVATYRVTSFRRGAGWPRRLHPPRVGAIGKLRLRAGVVTDLLTDVTFCGPAVNRCGA